MPLIFLVGLTTLTSIQLPQPTLLLSPSLSRRRHKLLGSILRRIDQLKRGILRIQFVLEIIIPRLTLSVTIETTVVSIVVTVILLGGGEIGRPTNSIGSTERCIGKIREFGGIGAVERWTP